MARTTLNLDPEVLDSLKRLQTREKKSLGRLASDLLAEAIAQRSPSKRKPEPFRWNSRSMEARVDLSDKDAIYAKLDSEP
jgi:hypothetical protein